MAALRIRVFMISDTQQPATFSGMATMKRFSASARRVASATYTVIRRIRVTRLIRVIQVIRVIRAIRVLKVERVRRVWELGLAV